MSHQTGLPGTWWEFLQGAATRMVGKTVFNPRSSRSHAVVMLLGGKLEAKLIIVAIIITIRTLTTITITITIQTVTDSSSDHVSVALLLSCRLANLMASEAASVLVSAGLKRIHCE